MKALQCHLKGRGAAVEKTDCKSSKCFLCLAWQRAVVHCCRLRGGLSLLSWAAFCPSPAAFATPTQRENPCAVLVFLPPVRVRVCRASSGLGEVSAMAHGSVSVLGPCYCHSPSGLSACRVSCLVQLKC